MSRIGKMPIAIPDGVTVEFKNGVVTVKGAKGTLSREIAGNIDVTTENGHVVLKALDDTGFTEPCLPEWRKAFTTDFPRRWKSKASVGKRRCRETNSF